MIRYIKFALFAAVLSFAVSCQEEEYFDEKPLHTKDEEASVMEKEETSLRLVQYNVGIFQKSGSSALNMVAAMMTELEADVIGLNEIDSCTTRSGKVQQTAVFADKMGSWKFNFSKAMNHAGGAYGVAATWRPDLKAVRMHDVKLPQSGGNEPRTMAVVEFENFIFATCHLDHSNSTVQIAQIAALNSFFDTNYGLTKKPIFITGDFNNDPSSETIKEMQKTWKLISGTTATFSSSSPKRCIDYIFVRQNGAEVTVVKTAVPRSFASGTVATASDHLPVFVDVTF